MKNKFELSKINPVFENVLYGKIDLKELKKEEILFLSLGEIGQLIFEDLENAVEHTPGYFFKSGIDLKTWKLQYEYLVVYLDYKILNSITEKEKFYLIRDQIIHKVKYLNEQEIEVEVNKFNS